MRETVRSLRVYFILAGSAEIFSSVKQLLGPLDPASGTLLVSVIAVAVALLVAGLCLPVWLRTRLPWVTGILWAGMVVQWILALYIGLSNPSAAAGILFILLRPAAVALLGFYLLRNARRLASESAPPQPTS
jgi:hypothetical protein